MKILIQFRAPIRFVRREHRVQQLAATLRFAAVFDLHAFAVVRENEEKVCAGPGTLAAPQRFEQAGSQCEQAEPLKENANAANGPTRRRAAIGPGQSEQRHGQKRGERPQPFAPGNDQRRDQHHSLFPNCS